MTIITKTVNKGATRREFVTRLGAAGLGVTAGVLIAGCGGSNSSSAIGSTGGDQNILNTAVTAEALSAVMYYNIINGPVYQALSSNTLAQAALVASFEQEIVHYNYLITQGATPLEATFYFPTNMFTDPQITLNTLVTVKDTMIGAYLFGIGNFSTTTLRVIAGQISGAESEQRALGRVAASSLNLSSVSGLAGSESLTAPTSAVNNLAFERTFSSAFPDINHVVTALGPFTAAGSTGYGTTPFTYASVSGSASAGKTAVTLSAVTP